MADTTALEQAVADLKSGVMAAADNMDKLFADFQAAQAANDQPAVDAATTAIQAEIQKLKDVVAADTAP